MNALSDRAIPLPTTYTLGDRQPQRVVQPTTVTEVGDLLAEATHTHTAVVPWGAGTRQFIVDPPRRYDVALDLRQLHRVIEYHPADLVVMVEAGISLEAVQTLLSERGQWLPWDPPTPPAATIGGLLATAAWGPLRLGYGGPREWILGMQVVLGDGRIVRSGGRVVKNVTGYDSHKLHLGACGTLGVIASVTFKVAPLPAQMASLHATVLDFPSAWRLAMAMRQPPLQPVALVIEVANTITLMARFAGVAAAVERQLALATTACANATALMTQYEDRTRWRIGYQMPTADLLLRIGVPDSMLPRAIDALTILEPAHILVFPGLGLIVAGCAETAAARLPALRQTLGVMGGYAVVERSSIVVDRWGVVPSTIDLMRALRQRWDPAGILNPGRWLLE
ncbi:FAD-binding oxidoreductase [Chloroflexus sp. Y-396-1]|uniref:FAD-binding oxidoreductase n=1 Tax=Chloroflexus sp. Y-396-1 TaxID=867845 RepID=UPI00048BA2BB|nr:FAD-binding oxidoreductase [Chloroflexus sp. Y-396-1]